MAARQTASKTEKSPVEIKLAHSPDSDDAFMFYALATHKLATPGYKYTHVLSDIQSLNEAALTETYDVTAISFAAYPTLRDKYILLDCGASFGEGYGPVVVSTKSLKPQDLKGMRIGVPGLKTSAYLTMKLFEPDFEAVVLPFDKIMEAVKDDVVEAGLLIHEGQLFFPQLGLHRVVDLGVWWQELTGLPLPLGGNAVRRLLGPDLGRLISRTIRDSVSYGLEHREEALNYAMQFAREMDAELADKFVGMYVNKWTLGYGEKGKKAVRGLIERGTAAGLCGEGADSLFGLGLANRVHNAQVLRAVVPGQRLQRLAAGIAGLAGWDRLGATLRLAAGMRDYEDLQHPVNQVAVFADWPAAQACFGWRGESMAPTTTISPSSRASATRRWPIRPQAPLMTTFVFMCVRSPRRRTRDRQGSKYARRSPSAPGSRGSGSPCPQ